MYHSLSIARNKNHVPDARPIENLPWGSGKGICLWRRGKTWTASTLSMHSPAKQGGQWITSVFGTINHTMLNVHGDERAPDPCQGLVDVFGLKAIVRHGADGAAAHVTHQN